MKIEIVKDKDCVIAVVSDDKKVIVDTQSALDLAMTVKYETGAANIVIDKKLVCDEFFVLSTGIAGIFCRNISISTLERPSLGIILTIPANP